MGRAKTVADVSDRVQELEDLVREYEEHEGCVFPTAFKIQKLMDILPEDAERQLILESTNTKPNFESLKNRVSQWVLLNHRGRSAMDCSHVGNSGYSGDRDTQMSEREDNSTWSGRGREEHNWFGQEEEEFRQENHSEHRSSYLGYNGMGHYDNEGLSGITKGKGKGKKGTGKGFGKQFQGCCNTFGTWGHKAIDCKSQGKGKDGARRHQGNKGKGPGEGGAKGFTKGKGKGMNNFEHSQRSWQAPPFTPDVLLIERKTEPGRQGYKKEQLSHVKQNTTTRMNSDPSQQWNVSVKWVQPPIKGNKKKVQVRNRFEALQTDAEEILTNDETVDPIWPEAITKKQDQNRRKQTHKRRVVSSKLNTRGNGKETSLCPLEKGKMLGNTEEGEEWKLMPRPLVIDSGAAETVMPTDWFTGHELKEAEESRGGQFYVCAGGKEITNYGERTLTLSTLDWSSIRNMTFQVTDVTKALGSVSKIVANGNKVVFDGSGSFIENKRSRERLWMREDNVGYVLDVYVAPPDDYDRKGFHRQGLR